MSKRFSLSTEQATWLKQNHSDFTNAHLARQLGCCVDTLKRIMMKMELAYFPGAKYHYRSKPKTWNRACMICGCKKSRPIQQYRCNSCHDREQATDYMWEDRMEEISVFKDRTHGLEKEINLRTDTVSYTHLTLPTNREV